MKTETMAAREDAAGAPAAGGGPTCESGMFRLAAERANEGVGITDAAGNYLFLNQEHVEMFGYRQRDELLGKSWRVLYDEEIAAQIEATVFPLLAASGQWRGRLKARRKDGSHFHESLSLSLLPGGGIVCNCQDISDQVAIGERLRQSETMFRVFLNTLPTAVTIRNLRGDYEFVNHATASFLGIEVDEAGVKRGMELCLSDKEVFEYWAAADRRVAARDEEVRFDFPMRWGGRDWVLDVQKLPLRINAAGVTHVCTLVNDVTERRRLEREEEEAARKRDGYHVMQREFISMVSHEFRTPLTTIQGAQYLLTKRAEELPGAEKANFLRLLDLQDRALGTLKELVDQVLLLNRIEHMSTETVPQPLRIADLARRIAGNFQSSLPPDRLVLGLELPEGYTAAVDEAQMRAVFENLISNGLKYSPDHQPVEMTLGATESGWWLRVKDRGRGIPKEDQAKLFRPFHRAKNVGQVPGTGLGLMIVRRVVDFHRGTLEFASEVGAGTTFTLKFPREFVAEPVPAAEHRGGALPFSKIPPSAP